MPSHEGPVASFYKFRRLIAVFQYVQCRRTVKPVQRGEKAVMKKRRVLLVAGGTGGHIYPAVTLAGELASILGKSRVVFAADRRPLAGKVIGGSGFRLFRVTSEPLPRKEVWHMSRFMIKIARGIIESALLLARYRPAAVVAFGAYTSVPVVIAAYVLRIPVIIHEQNGFPGLANKFLARFADKVAISFTASSQYFPKNKTVLTGNPVRSELLAADKDEAVKYFKLDPGKITVFVFGGSLGSLSINMNLMGILPYMEDYRDRVQFIHLCGDKSYEQVLSEYADRGFTARVFRYLDRMDYAYAAADIVVARAGATTIAEITALGKPSILIPFPGATSQHQALNAKPLCNIGGALCYPDELFSGEGLAVRLIPLINDSAGRKKISDSLQGLSERFTGAAERLASIVMGYCDV